MNDKKFVTVLVLIGVVFLFNIFLVIAGVIFFVYMNNNSVVYNEQAIVTKASYEIGDEGSGGGIVFYVSEEGFRVYDGRGGSVTCHYLEMSKETLGMSTWFPEYCDIGTKTGLGYGKANTYKILNADTSEELTKENCAAYKCSKYSTKKTKAGEWWLPSKDELELMYKNQKKRVLASCGTEELDEYHLSSSEGDWRSPWNLSFASGEHDYSIRKWFKHSVRAVRAF